jgi:hypothetical protein
MEAATLIQKIFRGFRAKMLAGGLLSNISYCPSIPIEYCSDATRTFTLTLSLLWLNEGISFIITTLFLLRHRGRSNEQEAASHPEQVCHSNTTDHSRCTRQSEVQATLRSRKAAEENLQCRRSHSKGQFRLIN